MKKNIILAGVVALIIIAIIGLQKRQAHPGDEVAPSAALVPAETETALETKPEPTKPVKPTASTPAYLTPAQKAAKYEPGHELAGISGYLNLPTGQSTLTLQSLVGKKVIMVDFWTYSCINCQRTLPYMNAWYSKYRDAGLEIIGVETPEFDFEKVKTNVQAAAEKFGIKYPIVQDNDYGTWTAYANRYWPRKYLLDIDGYVVYDHIGEGGYEETEKEIQYLLAERAARMGLTMKVPTGIVNPSSEKPMGGASPETYFGSSRNQYLANGTAGKEGIQTFNTDGISPAEPNKLYLDGQWNITPEFATPTRIDSGENQGTAITYRYTAHNVFFVASGVKPVEVRVLRDGLPLTRAQAGEDIIFDQNGTTSVIISEPRLYRLIKEDAPNAVHQLELEPETTALLAFTFTFG